LLSLLFTVSFPHLFFFCRFHERWATLKTGGGVEEAREVGGACGRRETERETHRESERKKKREREREKRREREREREKERKRKREREREQEKKWRGMRACLEKRGKTKALPTLSLLGGGACVCKKMLVTEEGWACGQRE
jgi:hypothetical protein